MPFQYYVNVPKSARKSLRKIPLPWQVRILDVLTDLETTPYLGEKMGGDMKDKRKIRVWPYRIIYKIQEDLKLIKIMEIEHRGHTSYD